MRHLNRTQGVSCLLGPKLAAKMNCWCLVASFVQKLTFSKFLEVFMYTGCRRHLGLRTALVDTSRYSFES